MIEDVLVSPEGIDLVQSSAAREDARLIPPGERHDETNVEEW